jgi:hypothetical protein
VDLYDKEQEASLLWDMFKQLEGIEVPSERTRIKFDNNNVDFGQLMYHISFLLTKVPDHRDSYHKPVIRQIKIESTGKVGSTFTLV